MPRKTPPTTVSITPETVQAAGRRPLSPAEAVGPEFVTKTPVDLALEQHVERSTMEAYTEERDLMNQMLGQAQAFKAISKFADVVSLQKLAHIKETKLYKALRGKRAVDKDGDEIADVGTWEGFCRVLGLSRVKVDEDLINLSVFGEEALAQLTAVGAGYRELRKLRKLPEDERLLIAKAPDRESLVELIDDMAAKHAAEKSALQKQVDESKADYEALDKNLARHKERADQAERDLDKLKHRVETESPDEYAAHVREEASLAAFAAEAALMGKLRPAFEALEKHAQEHDCTHENFMSGLLAQVEGAILHLRNRYDVKLVPDADERPDWTRDDFDADAVVAAALAKSQQEIGHA